MSSSHIKKRDLSHLSVEELAHLAKNYSDELDNTSKKKPSPNSRADDDEIARFILALDIKSGTEHIDKNLIYHEYMKWKDFKGYKTRMYVFGELRKRFQYLEKSIHGTRMLYFFMDPAAFNLTEEYKQQVYKTLRQKDPAYGKKGENKSVKQREAKKAKEEKSKEASSRNVQEEQAKITGQPPTGEGTQS